MTALLACAPATPVCPVRPAIGVGGGPVAAGSPAASASGDTYVEVAGPDERPLAPGAPVTISGVAHDVDGAVLGGAALVLEKEAPEDRDRADGTARQLVRAGDDGTFLVKTTGAQTLRSDGTSHTFRLTLGAPPGPQTTRRFQVTRLAHALGRVPLWRGPGTPATKYSGVGLGWPPLPGGVSRDYEIEVRRAGELVWGATERKDATPYGTGTTIFWNERGFAFEGGAVHTIAITAHQGETAMTSPVQTFTPYTDPQYRSYPMAIRDERGRAYPGLTDGDLQQAAFGAADAPRWLLLDLGQELPLVSAFGFGLGEQRVQLRVSDADGMAGGMAIGTLAGPFASEDLAHPKLRHVRLERPDGRPLAPFTEIRLVGEGCEGYGPRCIVPPGV